MVCAPGVALEGTLAGSAEHVGKQIAVVNSNTATGGVSSVDGVALFTGQRNGAPVFRGEESGVADGHGVGHGSGGGVRRVWRLRVL